MKYNGFDWDAGNWPKCAKHGLLKTEIEAIFNNQPAVYPDPFVAEQRLRAIGTDNQGRYILAVFTIRTKQNRRLIRPLSARYMHKKEIIHYEQQIKT